MPNQLAKAIALAACVFENKTDKAGKPYILHCIRVMNNVNQNDEELMQIAILHDAIEDTKNDAIPVTAAKLYELGFSERVVTAVKLLTHEKEIPYDDYIKAISHNPDATLVKLSDLRDNADILRIKGLRKKDIERTEKYHRAFIYLTN